MTFHTFACLHTIRLCSINKPRQLFVLHYVNDCLVSIGDSLAFMLNLPVFSPHNNAWPHRENLHLDYLLNEATHLYPWIQLKNMSWNNLTLYLIHTHINELFVSKRLTSNNVRYLRLFSKTDPCRSHKFVLIIVMIEDHCQLWGSGKKALSNTCPKVKKCIMFLGRPLHARAT